MVLLFSDDECDLWPVAQVIDSGLMSLLFITLYYKFLMNKEQTVSLAKHKKY